MFHAFFSWCFFALIALPGMNRPGEPGVDKGRDWSHAGEVISLDEARQYTKDFTFAVDGVVAHLFEKAAVQAVVSQENCKGVRAYHGRLRESGKPVLVLLGVDEKGRDLRSGVILRSDNGEVISAAEAVELTSSFTKEADGVIGHLFEAAKVAKIIAQENVSALRIYHGLNAEQKHVLVLIGSNSKGVNLVNGTMVERSLPCPPDCGNQGVVASN